LCWQIKRHVYKQSVLQWQQLITDLQPVRTRVTF